MYEQTNTMMETKTLFQIPQLLDGDDFTSEDLADDMEGLRLSFTRIKIPGGGHLQFEIPSGNPDVPDYAPYLEGVILYSHNSNAYWPEGSEYDDDQPPLCQSFDGKVGYGEPGGTCADCVLNQFGSDGNNKGKACKNMRMLYLLRSGEYTDRGGAFQQWRSNWLNRRMGPTFLCGSVWTAAASRRSTLTSQRKAGANRAVCVLLPGLSNL